MDRHGLILNGSCFQDGILWEGKLVSCKHHKRNLSRCFNFLLDIYVSSIWRGDNIWYNLSTFVQHALVRNTFCQELFSFLPLNVTVSSLTSAWVRGQWGWVTSSTPSWPASHTPPSASSTGFGGEQMRTETGKITLHVKSSETKPNWF